MKMEQPSWTRDMPTPLVVGIATLGPLGRRMKAPGTWGSLAGTLYFVLCFSYMGILGNLIASAIGAYVAIGFCGEAEQRLGKSDPGGRSSWTNSWRCHSAFSDGSGSCRRAGLPTSGSSRPALRSFGLMI
jgi:hypothetical protein